MGYAIPGLLRARIGIFEKMTVSVLQKTVSVLLNDWCFLFNFTSLVVKTGTMLIWTYLEVVHRRGWALGCRAVFKGKKGVLEGRPDLGGGKVRGLKIISEQLHQ
jgi:hypothetical protein